MRVTGSTEVKADWSVRQGAGQSAAGAVRSAEQLPGAAGQKQAGALDTDVLERIAERMSAAAESLQTTLQFKVVYGNRVIVQVVDRISREVLSEFPPERLVEAFRGLRELLGVLVDEKV
ncbi:putative FlaG/YvyC family protein [Symbiobacterium terraclitae]|uniref:FlaG/YvyC family protein n=1 Tax=Symbiobacterium terraclitae TaxID=557451 RepID=A0ABS4JN94_9FIRM|nr:flagellar protein FlaG [Symbiobacterium terraclitae]MBP2017018.1 putative FlaG/YvyC family protein [Symbiobacterium terraclitae]